MLKIEVQVKDSDNGNVSVKLLPVKIPKAGASQSEQNTGQVIFNEIGLAIKKLEQTK